MSNIILGSISVTLVYKACKDSCNLGFRVIIQGLEDHDVSTLPL